MPGALRPQSETTVAAMFDRIASRYDLLNHLLSFNVDSLWRKRLIAALPPGKELRVLDVATGTCDVLLGLQRARGDDIAQMIGIDISKGMIDRGTRKLAASGLSGKVHLGIMSASQLDFASDHFDFLSIAFGLRNVIAKENALAEFHRTLRPGGVLAILEFFEPERTVFTKGFQFYFNYVLPAVGAVLSDRMAYTYLPRSVSGFYSAEELRRRLENAGFREIREQRFLFGACRLFVGRKG